MAENLDIYNAAVSAQEAAADWFARARCSNRKEGTAWLNQFGAYCYTKHGTVHQCATPEETARFVTLTRNT
jgi:hypothetical protein